MINNNNNNNNNNNIHKHPSSPGNRAQHLQTLRSLKRNGLSAESTDKPVVKETQSDVGRHWQPGTPGIDWAFQKRAGCVTPGVPEAHDVPRAVGPREGDGGIGAGREGTVTPEKITAHGLAPARLVAGL